MGLKSPFLLLFVATTLVCFVKADWNTHSSASDLYIHSNDTFTLELSDDQPNQLHGAPGTRRTLNFILKNNGRERSYFIINQESEDRFIGQIDRNEIALSSGDQHKITVRNLIVPDLKDGMKIRYSLVARREQNKRRKKREEDPNNRPGGSVNSPGGSSYNPGGSSYNPPISNNPGGSSSYNPGGSNYNPGGSSNNNPGGSNYNPGGSSNNNPGGSNYNPGGSSYNPGGSNYNPGGSNSNPGGSNSFNPGGSNSYNPGGSNSFNPGGSNTFNPGGSNSFNPGGSNSNPGGSNSYNPGGSNYKPGGSSSYNPGGSNYKPGGSNSYNPGGSNYKPGGSSSYNPGGSNYKPGGSNSYNPGGSSYKPGGGGSSYNPGGSNYNSGVSFQNPGGSTNWQGGSYNPGGSNQYNPGTNQGGIWNPDRNDHASYRRQASVTLEFTITEPGDEFEDETEPETELEYGADSDDEACLVKPGEPNCGSQWWWAKFKVQDDDSGLHSVKVTPAGKETYASQVYYRYINFPIGSTMEHEVYAAASCCIESMRLTVKDVAGETAERYAVSDGTGSGGLSKTAIYAIVGASVGVILIIIIVVVVVVCKNKYSEVSQNP